VPPRTHLNCDFSDGILGDATLPADRLPDVPTDLVELGLPAPAAAAEREKAEPGADAAATPNTPTSPPPLAPHRGRLAEIILPLPAPGEGAIVGPTTTPNPGYVG
jgi:hypothetical protein